MSENEGIGAPRRTSGRVRVPTKRWEPSGRHFKVRVLELREDPRVEPWYLVTFLDLAKMSSHPLQQRGAGGNVLPNPAESDLPPGEGRWLWNGERWDCSWHPQGSWRSEMLNGKCRWTWDEPPGCWEWQWESKQWRWKWSLPPQRYAVGAAASELGEVASPEEASGVENEEAAAAQEEPEEAAIAQQEPEEVAMDQQEPEEPAVAQQEPEEAAAAQQQPEEPLPPVAAASPVPLPPAPPAALPPAPLVPLPPPPPLPSAAEEDKARRRVQIEGLFVDQEDLLRNLQRYLTSPAASTVTPAVAAENASLLARIETVMRSQAGSSLPWKHRLALQRQMDRFLAAVGPPWLADVVGRWRQVPVPPPPPPAAEVEASRPLPQPRWEALMDLFTEQEQFLRDLQQALRDMPREPRQGGAESGVTRAWRSLDASGARRMLVRRLELMLRAQEASAGMGERHLLFLQRQLDRYIMALKSPPPRWLSEAICCLRDSVLGARNPPDSQISGGPAVQSDEQLELRRAGVRPAVVAAAAAAAAAAEAADRAAERAAERAATRAAERAATRAAAAAAAAEARSSRKLARNLAGGGAAAAAPPASPPAAPPAAAAAAGGAAAKGKGKSPRGAMTTPAKAAAAAAAPAAAAPAEAPAAVPAAVGGAGQPNAVEFAESLQALLFPGRAIVTKHGLVEAGCAPLIEDSTFTEEIAVPPPFRDMGQPKGAPSLLPTIFPRASAIAPQPPPPLEPRVSLAARLAELSGRSAKRLVTDEVVINEESEEEKEEEEGNYPGAERAAGGAGVANGGGWAGHAVAVARGNGSGKKRAPTPPTGPAACFA